ncbi:MAG: hypothetical protein OXC14_00995 [Rhodospirillaceae bacterium]|nr:hypothetical protein [Rhodospirillaceae bacterium]
MGHWTHSRVGGGPWVRVWVTDEEEARLEEDYRELGEAIESARSRLDADTPPASTP